MEHLGIEREMKMSVKNVLELFKVMVVDKRVSKSYEIDAKRGFVTDFKPTQDQLKVLREVYKPLDVTTLFTVQERDSADVFALITKQLLHYIEVYGLDSPGLFNLEVTGGKIVTMNFVRGVSKTELGKMVCDLLYTNAPVKDAKVIKEIIDEYDIKYDINKIKNNELRVILFDIKRDRFASGDDAVRYIVYKATDKSLLIKSPAVLAAVKAKGADRLFLERHVYELAKVFNRHKRIIIAAKTKANRSVINKISRMSKDAHVPMVEPLSKNFVRLALTDNVKVKKALEEMTVRDKFKFLNLLEYKKMRHEMDAFIIRNGKVHLEHNRPVYDVSAVDKLMDKICASLKADLKHLKKSVIVLDKNVDYGLPVSRKQTLGNLPFGTTVEVDGNIISSGIYWENAWGARDLDLSAIDTNGFRTGWGRMSGYSTRQDDGVVFSGDLTDATNGAMEFMTSKVDFDKPYGLLVNIFNGEPNCQAEIVVGSKAKQHWIEKTVLREKCKLQSRSSLLGFVKNGKFVVYSTNLGNRIISGTDRDKAVINRGTSGFWTVRRLLEKLDIPFLDVYNEKVKVDHNLTYQGFTFDRLEKMFAVKSVP